MTKKINKQKAKAKANSKHSLARFLVPAGILAFAFFSFLPALDCGFVNWDDDKNFYENILITSLNSNNFIQNSIEIFQTKVIGNYNPLTIFSFAIEKQVFGFEQPMYWHLNNILLHLITTLFVFLIARQLKLSMLGAAVLALLFAVHPMRVESVVWITERKDVLFASFYFAAIYQYIKLKADQKNLRWLWIYLFFILSLLSKIQAVSLPLSFIALDYYLDNKLAWKQLTTKIPLFALSLLVGWYGLESLESYGSLESNADFGLIERFCIGGYSLLIYIFKSIIPFKLSPLYPYPSILPWYIYASVLSFPAVAIVGWYAFQNAKKDIVFGLGFFFVNIVFMLQILGAGQGFLADRFTYVAYFGLFFILAKQIEKWNAGKYRWHTITAAVIGIGIFSFMSFQQSKIWKDSGTLWTHVLKYTQNSTLPYGNRGNFYRDQGMHSLALADYNKRIALKADEAAPFNSRAKLYFNSNNNDTLQLALHDYSQAIRLAPGEAEYYINRGAAYARLNLMNKALADFNQGLALDPNFANGYLNRSVVYNALAEYQPALDDALKFLEFRPYSADIWYQAGVLNQNLQNFQASIPLFNKAIENKRNIGMFYYQRSKSYFMTSDYAKAKQDVATAQKLGFKTEADYLQKLNSI